MNLEAVLAKGGRPLSLLLSGPARIYGAAVALRTWAYARGYLETVRLPVPVFCFGNLTVGGTGKTPGVIWLVHYLKAKGRRPAIITRGYGRRASERPEEAEHAGADDVRRVAETIHRFGDEPVLFARRLPGVPVLASADRALVAHAAVEKYGADCLVMDDGFQHFRLFRDADLVCVDALKDAPLFLGGAARLLPAGRLREPLPALARARVVFLTKFNLADPGEAERLAAALRQRLPQTPIVPVRYSLAFLDPSNRRAVPAETLKDSPVLAMSGLASPESFEAGLKRLGASVASARFPDHHVFTAAEREVVLRRANAEGRRIVVTEKDHVRLPADFPCLVARLEWLPEGTEAGSSPPSWMEKIDSVIS